jgi:tRNA nucleotidyltransferase (CCA-adding enzyme)
MDIILTHEQADFDAVAALLGAHLMNEKAYPVLPRKLNRNVRAFLTLYGAELPFIDARDLPAGPIKTITLVDTQSLVTLKGMSQRTAVHVVDHHSQRPDLPENWSLTIDPTGSCTTLFVEGLHEHNGHMNAIQATLLLLGIYEDTGALSYVSTTPRDVRAVAYLLEQGGSLQIAARYLNPPLSGEQRQVYDRLLASAQMNAIDGLNILVAVAQADELSDEISTIAHKLRDLIDPDALFLLVRTPEGIRLVARSVSDRIDAAQVALQFGGGGHGRAAAALIRQTSETGPDGQDRRQPDLESVHARLLSLLPTVVQPAASVRHIMSPGPLVLAPDTPAEKAAQLMQRYGYEGYPVVADGKVIGLLTRRAVDRAIAHKLNLPATSLMEAGAVSVSPSDSIDHLRRVMTDSGWGQVPVVSPESGQVVGIVTRTDLLKTLGDRAPAAGKPNLAARLEAAMPPARLALLKAVAEKSFDQRLAIYIVGGFVRDLLLDRPSLDFDLVVEGDAIQLAKALAQAYGGRVLSHSRFGTAKWNITAIHTRLAAQLSNEVALDPNDLPESLDLISARTEFYDYPTALPTVERSSIKLDLHRRDFTINTMALRLDGRHYGELYDYWGGLRDLQRGLIRVLHSLSFVDDPTRLIRAVRFEQRFAFQIEERTRQLMAEAHPMVRHVSGDRLRHELNLVLAEQHPQAMLVRLDELGLLSAIHPALTWPAMLNPVLERALHGEPAPGWDLPERMGNLTLRQALAYLVWLLHSAPDVGQLTSTRLRLPGDLTSALAAAHKAQLDLPALKSARPSLITARLDQVPVPALYAVFLSSSDAELCALLETYVKTWRRVWPVTDGNILREMNLQPGPHYRTLLSTLRAAWLDGEVHTPQEEQELLTTLIQNLLKNGQAQP